MSDNIPFEIQMEIMQRLPVKSLIQFRTVSNTWKSAIDSSDFITHYNTQLQHLLVWNDNEVRLKQKYVSIVDDDSFPKQRVSQTLHPLVKKLDSPDIISSSHGLLCLYGYSRYAPFCGMAVIWNITIRKAVAVVLPNVSNMTIHGAVLGFGVCRETTDPKIVKITQIKKWSDMENNISWHVGVFKLSTGAWRSSYINNLPRRSIAFGCSQVVDGIIYWHAMDVGLKCFNLIISFDITSEEFKDVNLPHSLAHDTSKGNLYISKLRKSLVVLQRDKDEMKFVVWIMDDGVPKTFTKLFTIRTLDKTILTVLEFRKSGEPVIEYLERGCAMVADSSSLAVYDPYSKHFDDLEINERGSYSVYAYMETLLLLDQPNFTVELRMEGF